MPPVFEKVPTELNFAKEEREILTIWKDKRIFERSLEERAGAPPFVFYEGPPTANGLPHNGHVLTRVIKDLFPRYKTMRGYQVPRKAGWDTHGLPVEVEVEKELHIHGKAAIEAYGVEPFIAKCIESVFRYTHEWEHLTQRVAFWVDLDQAYVTYHQSYVESVWWALSELFKKGLLYQGHKVVWWWAQGGTALSSAEVGQGYKQVDDPSVFVAFPLVNEPDVSLLVWTTTPWTLPSNMYAAVHPDFEYAVVRACDRKFIVAKGLIEPLSQKLKTEIVVERTMKGRDLANLEYRPPFDLYASQQKQVTTKDGTTIPAYWRVILADFVLLDASGIVHVAPAFGEDDHLAFRKEQARLADPTVLELFCAVNSDGTFIPELARYAGRWVKEADKDIQHELKERGLLVHAETYRHEYPFCWRADSDPLIQYARPAWYIRTTAQIERAIANNRAVQWLPEHIKEGRMGDFLANNVDWALSRERYWGTPLNIWMCDQAEDHKEAPSSVAEIQKRNPQAFDHFYAAKKKDPSLNDHLIVHKPWIDQVTFPCATCGGTMRRVPEVIDCWFDSGCMPFAQWGFPHKGDAEFKRSFPADFISEAIDQTRGWFYSLLMISTLLFDEETQKRLGLSPVRDVPHPYKTCIVLGHITDREGKKESKSKGNYTPPEVILDKVAMEFAVLDAKDAHGIQAKPGVALIAREDLEGLDLQEGAKVRLYRANDEASARDFVLQAGKKMRRRVVVLDPKDREALGLAPAGDPQVKPADVLRLPANERVTIEDPSTPAPGADAFRWFFYASNPPWNATRHSLSNVRALQKEFAVKLRNVYSFFTIYANIDGYDPSVQKASEPTEIDRWIRSELELTVDAVTKDMDAYDVYAATQKLTAFVDALSNWYVRRSRDRFWRSGWDADKQSAYDTLYSALVKISLLTAPFIPFASESMYRNLTGPLAGKNADVKDSVHLASWPTADLSKVDRVLSRRMREVRELVSLGLQVRTQHKLKVRQPLRAAHLVLADKGMAADLAGAEEMIKEELNVLGLELVPPDQAERFVHYSYKPSFRSLGQKGLGKEAQQLKKAWASLDAAGTATLGRIVREGEGTFDGVPLTREDIEVAFETKEGFAAAGDKVGVVVLETTLDDELRELGYLRELQNRVQTMRKEMGLEYTDRIRLWAHGGEKLGRVLKAYGSTLAKECLAVEVSHGEGDSASAREVDVEGEKVRLGISRV